MVVLQVGQIVREVGEVVADAGPQVLANTTIDRCQDAAVVLIEIRQAKLANFSQGVPLFEEAPVNAQHGELRSIVKEDRLRAVQARLSQSVRILSAHRPVSSEIVGN